jgi:putative membrane protein
MTLPVERTRSRRPITWVTLIGVLLLPVIIGGILVAALYNPTERLGNMSAAIVNQDEAVEIDGQLVPLGRQLTGGLVAGSAELDSNIDWTISNEEDAASGLADGTYSAIVTIPSDFSAAATSTAPGSVPQRATIEVETAPDGRIVDDAITAQIAQTAAAVFGSELSKTYLQNVFLGFTTLQEQLGEAASGAGDLADGAGEAAAGAGALADGAAQLGDGAGRLAGGARGIADGAGQLAAGAGALAGGAASAASGLNDWANGADELAAGSRGIADGLNAAAGAIPPDVVDAATRFAANTGAINAALTDAANDLARLAAECDPTASSPEFCAALATAAADAQAELPNATGLVEQAGVVAAGVGGLASGLQELSAGSTRIADGVGALASGARDAANGVAGLSDGAAQLAAGATALDSGADQLAAGTGSLASGAGELSTGVDAFGAGIGQLADGTRSLADGLGTAVEEIPGYTDDEATDLAAVVADPVSTSGLGTNLFGASAIPLLAMLVLWFGGLGTFVVLQAVSRRALSSRRPSALLMLGSFLPAAGIGALQGLLVAGIVQLAASYGWAEWSLFAALCVVAGVAFAAVNQALVAVFGGAGRWIAAVGGALALATGVVSTVPTVLTEAAAFLPTAPAYSAMLGALTSSGGIAAGVAGMLVWTVLSLVATTLMVARRRTVSARAALSASAL